MFSERPDVHGPGDERHEAGAEHPWAHVGTAADEAEKVEVNELARVDFGITLQQYRDVMSPSQRLLFVLRWFREGPRRTRRQSRELLSVDAEGWAALGSTERYERACQILQPLPSFVPSSADRATEGADG